MHIGHCRGAVVGDALANLLAKTGHDVTKEYYINDAGVQVTALAWAAYWRYLQAIGTTLSEADFSEEVPGGLQYRGEYLIPIGEHLAERYGASLAQPDGGIAAPEVWLDIVRNFTIAAMLQEIREDLLLLGVHQHVFTSERAMIDSGAVDAAIEWLQTQPDLRRCAGTSERQDARRLGASAPAKMVKANLGYAVMEVSSHALDQERVWGCRFEAAVFTNLSRDHYEYHGTVETYFAAKARLFQDLASVWHILNLDDPYGQQLLHMSRARLLTYALEGEATCKPSAVRHGLDGIRFTLSTTKGQLEIASPLVGRHNVYNLLAGIAVAIALDIDARAIMQGITQLQQVPGRLERV